MEELKIIREKHNNEIKRIKAQLFADIALEMVKHATLPDPEIVAGRARLIVGLLYDEE